MLDFGCGTGVLTVELARWARHVTAIDRSGAALDKARGEASRQGLTNITFLEADLHALPLPTASVDLIVVSQSLHHVERCAGINAHEVFPAPRDTSSPFKAFLLAGTRSEKAAAHPHPRRPPSSPRSARRGRAAREAREAP